RRHRETGAGIPAASAENRTSGHLGMIVVRDMFYHASGVRSQRDKPLKKIPFNLVGQIQEMVG
ncbi:hypothetical protein, partial [Telmatospirillum sp.]|uniref:hypothetical protein n=1 Tax=Telmatospirillum sp. TaxID=2079197 RepID=UPI0028426E43